MKRALSLLIARRSWRAAARACVRACVRARPRAVWPAPGHLRRGGHVYFLFGSRYGVFAAGCVSVRAPPPPRTPVVYARPDDTARLTDDPSQQKLPPAPCRTVYCRRRFDAPLPPHQVEPGHGPRSPGRNDAAAFARPQAASQTSTGRIGPRATSHYYVLAVFSASRRALLWLAACVRCARSKLPSIPRRRGASRPPPPAARASE